MKMLIAICIMFPIYSFAENNINDYAFAYNLNTTGDEPIYGFEIPESIYEQLTSPQYADIRIFNADKIAVPYSLQHKINKIEQASSDYNISFFPMFVSPEININTTSININTRQDGTVINVNPNNNTRQQNNSILLDLSQFEKKPTIFTLQWADTHPDFNQVISIKGSDDLAIWNTINQPLSLSSLHFSEHYLVKNTLNLPQNNWKYLRISWASTQSLMLQSISGRNSVEYLDLPRQTKILTVERYDNKTKSFFYANTGRFPIDRVSVRLKPRNSLLNITISSSDKKEGPWRTRHNSITYNLKKDGQLILSDAIKINTSNDLYWRIKADSGRDNLESFSPDLEIGWLPHNLTFVAEGTPPFTVAFGNREAIRNVTDNAVTKLIRLQGDKKIPQAKLDLESPITLGGVIRLTTVDESDFDLKTLTLWSVLILGLIVLTLMVLKLYKQINNETS